jgi:hypothetical protein
VGGVKIFLALSLVMAAFGMSVAAADGALVPPGNSAATQYSETLPGAGGEEAHQKSGSGGKESGSGEKGDVAAGAPPVSSETATELRALGPEGEAALSLANSSAPPRPAATGSDEKGEKGEEAVGATGGAGGGPSAGGGTGPGNGGSSGVGEVLGGAAGTSSGGLGFLQPLIIALVLVCAVAYAVRRRRDPEPRTGSSLR